MTSIRKTKKALKREIRRIDAVLLKLPQKQTPCLSMSDWWASASGMWDLFLWRNYIERKLNHLRKAPELGVMPTFTRSVSPERTLNQIKGTK